MSIELEHLTKRYGALPVVDDVSLSIGKGELFVLLGPSGSGKSTLLRMIAGLVEVDVGSVRLHGRDVSRVAPKDRGIGFVFQHYGLFRHMSVADNVEFALRIRKVPASRRRQRREELLQMVGLAGLGDRRPRQLSGGQQQRVALARALAHEPQVLLLDEPFGALDAKIRHELRASLRRIQQELRVTAVFVTHDQEEAFELADRIAVLRQGRLLEVGPPQELYLRPRSPFVATFLGAANLLVAPSTPLGVQLGPLELPITSETIVGRSPRRMQVLFRPEDVDVSYNGVGDRRPLGLARVESATSLGGFERLRLRLPPLRHVRSVAPAQPFGEEGIVVEALRSQYQAARLPLQPGSEAWLSVRRFHVLAPANLRVLVDNGESAPSRAAADLGRELSARLDAQVSLLGSGAALHNGRVDPATLELGAETEHAEEGFDLLVLGLSDSVSREGDARWLNQIRHHILVVPGPAHVPSRLLVCVTMGEHGKADVRFAERLAWQLGASATVLTVLSDHAPAFPPPHVESFLATCAGALGTRGVTVQTRLRRGRAEEQIRAEIEDGDHDLVVLGAPHRARDGRLESRSGVVPSFLRDPPPCPVLLVRR